MVMKAMKAMKAARKKSHDLVVYGAEYVRREEDSDWSDSSRRRPDAEETLVSSLAQQGIHIDPLRTQEELVQAVEEFEQFQVEEEELDVEALGNWLRSHGFVKTAPSSGIPASSSRAGGGPTSSRACAPPAGAPQKRTVPAPLEEDPGDAPELGAAASSRPTGQRPFPVLEQFYFRRIVLDEFHEIPKGDLAHLIQLRGVHRFGLSGTPDVSTTQAVHSLARLMRASLVPGQVRADFNRERNLLDSRVRKELAFREETSNLRRGTTGTMGTASAESWLMGGATSRAPPTSSSNKALQASYITESRQAQASDLAERKTELIEGKIAAAVRVRAENEKNCQAFLEQFTCQNTSNSYVDSIEVVEHSIPITLSAREKILYLDKAKDVRGGSPTTEAHLDVQANLDLAMRNRPAGIQKNLRDRAKEEELLQLCSHFSLGEGSGGTAGEECGIMVQDKKARVEQAASFVLLVAKFTEAMSRMFEGLTERQNAEKINPKFADLYLLEEKREQSKGEGEDAAEAVGVGTTAMGEKKKKRPVRKAAGRSGAAVGGGGGDHFVLVYGEKITRANFSITALKKVLPENNSKSTPLVDSTDLVVHGAALAAESRSAAASQQGPLDVQESQQDVLQHGDLLQHRLSLSLEQSIRATFRTSNASLFQEISAQFKVPALKVLAEIKKSNSLKDGHISQGLAGDFLRPTFDKVPCPGMDTTEALGFHEFHADCLEGYLNGGAGRAPDPRLVGLSDEGIKQFGVKLRLYRGLFVACIALLKERLGQYSFFARMVAAFLQEEGEKQKVRR